MKIKKTNPSGHAPPHGSIPTDWPENPRLPLALSLLLAIVTLALFWPVGNYDFINYDDPEYFVQNTHVQHGLTARDIGWAFQTGATGNWHPLTWLSLMLDAQLFGVHAAGPHLVNVLLHVLNTVLVFWVLRRLTAATWRSAFVAALFGWHPLHVESVAWISERKDVLSTFFGLLTLLAYAKYTKAVRAGDPGRKKFYVAALVLFACGLMSKPMLVTLPFLLVLLDYWPLQRWSFDPPPKDGPKPVEVLKEKIPFFLLSAFSCVITVIMQEKQNAIADNVPLDLRVGNAFVSCLQYLEKLAWPARLAIPYPYPEHLGAGQVLFSLLLLAGASWFVIRSARTFPFLFTGWFWFLGMLVPVIGLIQVGIQSMADRYSYLPLIGMFIVLVWGFREVAVRAQLVTPIIVLITGTVLVACLWRTRDQLRSWQNTGTLFRHTIDVVGDNDFADYNIGWYLDTNGQNLQAIDYYRKALQLNPRAFYVYNNLGVGAERQGNLKDAIPFYREAVRLNPNDAGLRNNLGVALAKAGDWDAALEQFSASTNIAPDDVGAYNDLGITMAAKGKTDEAIRYYQKAIAIDPDYAEAHLNFGDTLIQVGRINEAIVQFKEALRLKPDFETARQRLKTLGQ